MVVKTGGGFEVANDNIHTPWPQKPPQSSTGTSARSRVGAPAVATGWFRRRRRVAGVTVARDLAYWLARRSVATAGPAITFRERFWRAGARVDL